DVLAPELANLAIETFDITEQGNWDGLNILTRAKSNAEVARRLGLDEAAFQARLVPTRCQLYELRDKRPHPARDEKVLTDWNGLIIQALAEGARVLGDPTFLEAATRAATAILSGARSPDGSWLRTGEPGYRPAVAGFLDDYAYFTSGLISLYEASGRVAWLSAALDLTETMVGRFGSATAGDFSFSGQANESLPIRNL